MYRLASGVTALNIAFSDIVPLLFFAVSFFCSNIFYCPVIHKQAWAS